MRVLLFHKGGIGDVVFGLPLMRDLKAAWPQATLTVLTHRQGQELLALSPHVDRALSWGSLGQRWTLGAAGRALGSERFDVAVNTDQSPRAAWLVFRRAPVRAGFARGPEQLLYTHRAPVKPFEVLFAARFQRLGRALGLAAGPPVPQLSVGPQLLEAARARLAAAGWKGAPLLAVHAGGGWPTKQWPIEQLERLSLLAAQRFGAQLLFLGAEGDRARVQPLVDSSAAVSGLGAGIGESVAMAKLCRAAVGIDSGLSHAAAAAGVPTVFLFGPNDERSISLGPSQALVAAELPCRPCNRAARVRCPLEHHRCMRELTAELVLERLAPYLRDDAATRARASR